MHSYSLLPSQLSSESPKEFSSHQKKSDIDLKGLSLSSSYLDKMSYIGVLLVVSSIVGFNMLVTHEVALLNPLSPSEDDIKVVSRY